MWFQRELPYPAVDLGDIKAKTQDAFPKNLEGHIIEPEDGYTSLQERIRKGKFFQRYREILSHNFKAHMKQFERIKDLEKILI